MKKAGLPGMIIRLLSALMLLSLGGCGQKDATKDESLKNIIDNGELVLGLDENFPPMGFRDETGEITGFDIDLAKEVCDRLDVELKCQPIDWDKKEDILNAGDIDCIWNGLAVTDERRESMLLSEPYIENEVVFAVARNSNVKKLDDLKGKKVGVQSGSSAFDVIKETKIYDDMILMPADDNVTLLNELKAGEIDAVFLDSIVIYYIARESDDYVLLRQSFSDEGMAVGFRKGDAALRNKIQETLSDMKADGKLAEISEKWFGSDITIVR